MSYDRVWTVRFSDTDPFGIAHYPRIVDALHETSDMFMEEIGYPFWEISQDHGFGLPLVEIDFEFESPVEAGDDVTIALTPEVGTRSVRFDYTATCGGSVAFEGYEQRVCAEHGGGGAIEVPADLRDAMVPYEE
ncbi:acyl-CoA thioesterase [Haloarcula halophila]|uniref:acyl-CoA thioesterase n=1 Tax=Haloarcula TaxID=2237 RepID=UPI0023E44008|nr:thioesterase family protein [Halomicroarcula sp. DFY41]